MLILIMLIRKRRLFGRWISLLSAWRLRIGIVSNPSVDSKAPSVRSKGLVGVEEYYPTCTLVFDPREDV